MQKFKLTWEMWVEDDELLEMVNYDEENQYEKIEDVPVEVMISAMNACDYIDQEIEWIETEDVTVEKIN